ncbi:MAG: hypothetical protein Q4D58_06200 [Synergistaceae bacterium]|nr:hypothetical protein [Synergistaceae bacterium]
MAVKNDEDIKKSLNEMEAHTGPYDVDFAKKHAQDIHAMAQRLNGERDDLWQRIKKWFEEHYDHLREHLHDGREDIERDLHRAHEDIDRHLHDDRERLDRDFHRHHHKEDEK